MKRLPRDGGVRLRRVAAFGATSLLVAQLFTVARADVPAYAWSVVATTPAPASMHPGQKVFLTVVARNEGSATWEADSLGAATPVRLAPVAPRDRSSSFASEDPTWMWSGGKRIAMATPAVRPGDIGIFTFSFTAPVLPSYPVDLTEHFAPTAEGVAWMDDVTASFTTRVRPAANAIPPIPNPPVPNPGPGPEPPCDPDELEGCLVPDGSDFTWSLVAATPVPPSMHPGQKAVVTVVGRNDGTATWRSDLLGTEHPVRLGATGPRERSSSFASEDPTWMWSGGKRILMATPVVRPGEHAIFSFTFTAPALPSYPADFTEHFAPVAEDLAWMDGTTAAFTTRVRLAANVVPPIPNPPVPNPGPLPTPPCDVPEGCIPPPPSEACIPDVERTYRDALPPAVALGYAGFGTPVVGPELDGPRAIAIDPLGKLVIADTGNDRILRIDETGNVLFSWGSSGSATGQFRSPSGVAVTATGRIYVADTGNDRIQVFSLGGAWLATLGGPGSGNGSFSSPSGLALVPTGALAGSLVVADTGNDRVQIVTLAGEWRATMGAGSLSSPTGVSAYGGDVYVADTGNDRVLRFAPDGHVSGTWGGPGSDRACMRAPAGVLANEYGVFVADTGNERLQRFSRAGPLVETWGTRGADPNQVRAPWGLAASASDLWVIEAGGNRAQRFRPVAATAPPIPCGSDPLAC